MRRIVSFLTLALALPSLARGQLSIGGCDSRCSLGDAEYAGVVLDLVCTDLPYGSDPCQVLDAYIVESSAPSPVLIELHGGGFHGGAKGVFSTYLDEDQSGDGVVERALQHGFSVVSVGYRLTAVVDACCTEHFDAQGNSPDLSHAFPAANDDVARAIQFVRHMAQTGAWNVDPARIAAIGGSAGATLASWVAMAADRADPNAPPTSPEAQSSRPTVVVSLSGPTQFTADFFYTCAYPHSEDAVWYFGALTPQQFNTDPGLTPVRQQASPAWLAALDGAPSAGFTLNRRVAWLGLYDGDPSWTLNDFIDPGLNCTFQPQALWKPTPNAHSIVFGLQMRSVLESIGSSKVDLLVKPPGACAQWNSFGSDYVIDFIAKHLQFVPHVDLSSIYPGKQSGSGLTPKLSAYGELTADGSATIWLRDAPPAKRAWLYSSPNQNPTPYQGGTLVPDQASLSILYLGQTDDCGHLSLTLPGGAGPASFYSQVVIEDRGASFSTGLTNAIRLDFTP